MKKILLLCLILNTMHLKSMNTEFPGKDLSEKSFNAVTLIPTDAHKSLEELDLGKAGIAALLINCGNFPSPENFKNAEAVKDKLPKTFTVFQAAQTLQQYKSKESIEKLMQGDENHALNEVKKIFTAHELIEKYVK